MYCPRNTHIFDKKSPLALVFCHVNCRDCEPIISAALLLLSLLIARLDPRTQQGTICNIGQKINDRQIPVAVFSKNKKARGGGGDKKMIERLLFFRDPPSLRPLSKVQPLRVIGVHGHQSQFSGLHFRKSDRCRDCHNRRRCYHRAYHFLDCCCCIC